MSFLKQMQECINECLACAKACNECYGLCLTEEDQKMMAKCIQLDRDCADICTLAAQFMATQSPFAMQLCQLCADICDACAEECEKHSHEHCKRCAEACRRCADACRRMVA